MHSGVHNFDPGIYAVLIYIKMAYTEFTGIPYCLVGYLLAVRKLQRSKRILNKWIKQFITKIKV